MSEYGVLKADALNNAFRQDRFMYRVHELIFHRRTAAIDDQDLQLLPPRNEISRGSASSAGLEWM